MESLEQITKSTRREWLMGIGTTALAAAWPIGTSAEKKVAYLKAMKDESKRQLYINQKVGKRRFGSVLSVEYTTPEKEQELATKYKYQNRELQFGFHIIDDLTKIGKGAKSRVYILPTAFSKLLGPYGKFNALFPNSDIPQDMDAIIGNIIDVGFAFSRYLENWILKYPIDRFKDNNGIVNQELLGIITQIIMTSEEYKGLLKYNIGQEKRFLDAYAINVAERGLNMYDALRNPNVIKGIDPKFLQELYINFHPDKLFPKPRTVKQI